MTGYSPIIAPPDDASPPPPPLPPPPSPERGSRLSTFIAWTVIVLSVALLLLGREVRQREIAAAPEARRAGEAAAELTLRLMGRYAVGFRSLFGATGAGAQQDAMIQLAERVRQIPVSPRQHVRATMVLGELLGNDGAIRELEKLKLLEDLPSPLREDLRHLSTIYTEGPGALDDASRKRLTDRHEWYGQLALGFNQPPADPARRQAIRAAQRTFVVAIIAALAGVLLSAAGIALFIIAIVLVSLRRIRAAYQPPITNAGIFIETFALYLAWMIGIGLIARRGGVDEGLQWFWVMVAGVAPLACLWPLARGVRFVELRHALGWNRGRGWAMEILSGIGGYIAGLPVIILGIVATAWLARFMQTQPTHPVVEEILGPGRNVLAILLLASIYAPLAEETLFRGALYHGMRRSVPFLITVIVVAFIFAAIHPQGLAAIPALMAIAIVLAALREWRGSIVAPVVAHAIHNSIILVVLLLAVR